MVFVQKSIVITTFLLLCGAKQTSALTTIGKDHPKLPEATVVSRRDSLKHVFESTMAAGALVASTTIAPQLANAASEGSLEAASTEAPAVAAAAAVDETIDVYFGCGCFWHVQHEFVEAEKKILKRSNADLTSRAGYAGGRAKDNLVCYHNARNVGDYGKLGHAEVVALSIPSSKFKDFAEEYFRLFDKDGNRPDQFGDRGPEYRNLVGIPGGTKSQYAKDLVAASIATGDKLDFAVGKGDDKDVRATTFVMDTATYPFYVGEQYHQFHDGFNLNENYPNSYNSLASDLAKSGALQKSMCPNGALGLGVGGL